MTEKITTTFLAITYLSGHIINQILIHSLYIPTFFGLFMSYRFILKQHRSFSFLKIKHQKMNAAITS